VNEHFRYLGQFLRPNLAAEIRILIRNMSQANPLWGAPRIHGELLKLGIEVAQSTVAKYLRRPPKPPSQTWRTFLTNHMDQMASIDFFVVPTATFRILFVFVVLSHARRRVLHFQVTDTLLSSGPCSRCGKRFPGITRADIFCVIEMRLTAATG
jgi:putative transposase